MFASSLCLVSLVFWCGVDVVSAQLEPVGCDLSRIPVQRNFDTKRFVGRWNELLWVAPVEEAAYDASDYYWLLHNDTAQSRGVFNGFQSGRDEPSGHCFGASITLRETDRPGVLLLNTTVNNYVTRYYVMDTDYDTYANTYGCYTYNGDSTRCYAGRAWLWARGSSLPQEVRQKALRSWEHLCLDLQTLLKVTPVKGNDCPFHG
ncbi:purpurin-like [Babylonia areolata]|uniref:purpurin-like n=1 Tax=Babylonia areolata TaxID=304850 RepID=UPI003FD15B7C